MPSKMTVALSLDDESSEIWDGLPRGERSHYVRESMKEIDLVRVQEDLIRKLRARLDAAEKKIKDMRLFLTGVNQ